MIGAVPLCESCRRLDREGTGYTCEAFPAGIPSKIAVDGFDHRKPFPGDGDLRYQPMEGRVTKTLRLALAAMHLVGKDRQEAAPGTIHTHGDGSRWIKRPDGEWGRLEQPGKPPPKQPAPTAASRPARSFKPGVRLQGTLNGVAVQSWDAPKTPEEWKHVKGQKQVGAPPFKPRKSLPPRWPGDKPLDFHSAAGAIVQEPDGRVWVVSPKGSFGGYKNTFPKGTIEEGLSVQATTIKEVYEESGLQIEITGFLGDFDRSTSRTRYYLARRVGGTPADAGEETEAVHLVPPEELGKYLTSYYDQDILQALSGRGQARKQEGARP